MTHEEAKAAILQREQAKIDAAFDAQAERARFEATYPTPEILRWNVDKQCYYLSWSNTALSKREGLAYNALWDGWRTARKLQPVAKESQCPATVGGKYDFVLRPFVNLMAQELHANAHKGDRPGWLKMTAPECLLEVYYHVAKLEAAVESKDTAHIAEYAADVANLCMMLTDIADALGVEKP